MAGENDPLRTYREKRDFSLTPEPDHRPGGRTSEPIFLVQKHDARRLHYDFRLEWQGILLSWAVTKGPSNDPSQKRLAVRTEDHPLSYQDFEGSIPKGQYGGGTVMLWDKGLWHPQGDTEQGLRDGNLSFTLDGQRMQGGYSLVRMKDKGGKRQNWLLIKSHDEFASSEPDGLTRRFTTSVTSGRDLAEIASGKDQRRQGADLAGDIKARAPKASGRPDFVKPQLATLVRQPPEGKGWLHESKFDGYRCLAAIGGGGVRLYTRSGLDWSDRFGRLQADLNALDCGSALLDGEVVAAHNEGQSDFSALQQALKQNKPLRFYAFDLLKLDGEDLRKKPLLERKKRLKALLAKQNEQSSVRYSEHIQGQGKEVLASICQQGGEGIISKRASAPYTGKRTKDWLKSKCTRRQEFVIGGYSPSDKPGRALSSLLLGTFEKGGFCYRGRVGSGFSSADLTELGQALAVREQETSPFVEVPDKVSRTARWVRPDLVTEIDFAEFTHDRLIRHGVYLGLREDKMAASVSTETPLEEKQGSVKQIKISHAEREVFPGAGFSKLDLAHYHAQIGERMIKIAGHHPLALLRCPRGIGQQCFFQKHAGKGFPEQVSRLAIRQKNGKTATGMYLTSIEALVACVQMGVIEFHLWGNKIDRMDRPDRLVFDLDPDEGLDFSGVKSAAFEVRDWLAELGLASVPVVTGGKGVHVCVLLRRTLDWQQGKDFSKTLAQTLAHRYPQRYTASSAKNKRRGKVFVDWLRNSPGASAVAPYSVRARKGAPVAIPVQWDELADLDSANSFGIRQAVKRLDRPCPYLIAMQEPQTLSRSVLRKLDI
ncbi:DNA ligase D [Bowmanella dokdonensis]|uniref:DNA ligase (ATP) n=1 Tax=Bowmanella dokdonensis TaxID=751969 RepID=A0A939DKM2_9ALTE|nr:DNA ligase D [Bowmanella dokdonensis]MBN7824300.1 DNA ligase D [Bowmanella dokdonensis]